MTLSKDNLIGLVLALSSSAFIGASFIIKKKGLRKAASYGVGAGLFLLSPFQFSILGRFFCYFLLIGINFFFLVLLLQELVDIHTCWSLFGGWAWFQVKLPPFSPFPAYYNSLNISIQGFHDDKGEIIWELLEFTYWI